MRRSKYNTVIGGVGVQICGAHQLKHPLQKHGSVLPSLCLPCARAHAQSPLGLPPAHHTIRPSRTAWFPSHWQAVILWGLPRLLRSFPSPATREPWEGERPLRCSAAVLRPFLRLLPCCAHLLCQALSPGGSSYLAGAGERAWTAAATPPAHRHGRKPASAPGRQASQPALFEPGWAPPGQQLLPGRGPGRCCSVGGSRRGPPTPTAKVNMPMGPLVFHTLFHS